MFKDSTIATSRKQYYNWDKSAQDVRFRLCVIYSNSAVKILKLL